MKLARLKKLLNEVAQRGYRLARQAARINYRNSASPDELALVDAAPEAENVCLYELADAAGNVPGYVSCGSWDWEEGEPGEVSLSTAVVNGPPLCAIELERDGIGVILLFRRGQIAELPDDWTLPEPLASLFTTPAVTR